MRFHLNRSAGLVLSLVTACGAFSAAARAGEPDLIGDLRRAVAEGEVPAALEAIDAIASARPAGAASAVARAYESDNAWIRRAAVRAVAVLGERRCLDVLLRAAGDRDALVRLDACRVAPRFAEAAGAGKEIRGALVSRLLDDERSGVRTAAALSLGALGDKDSAFALDSAALGDRDPRVRSAALGALAAVAGRDAFETLASALETDPDQRARASAAGVLGGLGLEEAGPPLARALKDVSGRVRVAAAKALGGLGTAEAVGALDGAFKLEDEDLHVAAAHALGSIGAASARAPAPAGKLRHLPAAAGAQDAGAVSPSNAAREALRRALFHPSGPARRSAAESLGYLGDAASLRPLARLTEDFDPEVRTAAVVALGGLADPRARAVVRRRLGDRIPEVRTRAAEAAGRLADTASIRELVGLTRPVFSDGERVAAAAALGYLGDRGAVDVLMGLLADSSEPVRRAAAAAIGRLGTGGEELLRHESSFAGDARVEFLGALAATRTRAARGFFEREIARHQEGSPGRFACEVGLFLLGEGERRPPVLEGARGGRPGASPTLAIIALVLAGAPEAEEIAAAAIRARAPGLRESAALALGVAAPGWAAPLLREAANDRNPRVALRARVGLRWLELRGASGGGQR